MLAAMVQNCILAMSAASHACASCVDATQPLMPA